MRREEASMHRTCCVHVTSKSCVVISPEMNAQCCVPVVMNVDVSPLVCSCIESGYKSGIAVPLDVPIEYPVYTMLVMTRHYANLPFVP